MSTRILEETITDVHLVRQFIQVPVPGAYYQMTLLAKPIGARNIEIYVTDTGSAYAVFGAELVGNGANIPARITAAGGFVLVSYSIQPPDVNGFYLLTMNFVANQSSTLIVGAHILVGTSSGAYSYTGTASTGAELSNFTLNSIVAPTQTIYVASAGSDTNAGTQANPWKTITKVNATPLGAGSQVFFNGGDTFIGNLAPLVVAGSAANPVVVGSYGTGRATLNPASGGFGTGVVNLDGKVGVTIQDLVIAAPDTAIQPRGGIRIANGGGGAAGSYVIQRCDISGIRFNRYVSADFGSNIMVELYPGTGGINNVTIKNCDIHGNSGATSSDDAGITGFGGQSASNWTYVGNLVWNIGSAGANSLNAGSTYPPMSNGIHQQGVSNALAKYNIVHDMGANFNNLGGGPCAFTTNNADSVTIRFNEGYRVRPSTAIAAVDFVGVDFDTGTTNCLCDYCFMHGNYNAGYYFFGGGPAWNNNTIRYCIGYDNCERGNPGWGEVGVSLGFGAGAVTTIHFDHNKTFNDRVYSGPLGGNENQEAWCFIQNNNGGFGGSVSNNIQITSVSRDGFTWPVWSWRTSQQGDSFTATVTGNSWYGPGGTAQIYFWQNVSYSTLAAFQTAAGFTGNSAANSAGPNVFATTATLSLTSGERTTAIAALTAVQSISGIETGTTAYGISLPGSRMASLITRFTSGDSPVTLPEYIALGFALTRADTAASNALLTRIEPIAMTAFQV